MNLKERLKKLGVWNEFVDEFLMQEMIMYDINKETALKQLTETMDEGILDLDMYIVKSLTKQGNKYWQDIREKIMEKK